MQNAQCEVYILGLVDLRLLSIADWKYLLASLVLCLCSVLSKEQGITGVAVCLTYDVFIAQKVTKDLVCAFTCFNTVDHLLIARF